MKMPIFLTILYPQQSWQHSQKTLTFVAKRFPVSVGVVLPANVLTGHGNVTAKISLPDSPARLQSRQRSDWTPKEV